MKSKLELILNSRKLVHFLGELFAFLLLYDQSTPRIIKASALGLNSSLLFIQNKEELVNQLVVQVIHSHNIPVEIYFYCSRIHWVEYCVLAQYQILNYKNKNNL